MIHALQATSPVWSAGEHQFGHMVAEEILLFEKRRQTKNQITKIVFYIFSINRVY